LNNFIVNTTIIIRMRYNSRSKLELLKYINFVIFDGLVVNQTPKVYRDILNLGCELLQKHIVS
jgi:hypothetical protein